MLRFFLATILIAFLAPIVVAQESREEIGCYSSREQNKPYKKKLWDGYEISLGPARNGAGQENGCTAAVYNSRGQVVFRTTGFGVVFEEDVTGMDVDGDGKPDVVFRTDTAGGNECCWAFNVISLSPKPRKLFDIDWPADFKKEPDERTTIWQLSWVGSAFTSEAGKGRATIVYRVVNARPVEATPEFCGQILASSGYRLFADRLTDENAKRFESAADMQTSEAESMATAVLSVTLQHVYCRQFDQGLRDLEIWPAATRDQMKTEFAEQIKAGYPEFAARLLASLGKK